MFGCERQDCISLSTTEAELVALARAVQECIFVRKLVAVFMGELDQPTFVFCDNKGALDLVANNKTHKRTKHIDIRYHFIREFIRNGTIELFYIESAKNIADVFTKALPVGTFIGFTRQLFGLVEARA